MVATRGLEMRKGEERCWAEAEPAERGGRFFPKRLLNSFPF